MSLRDRVGTFTLDGKLIDTNPDLVAAALSRCIVVRCEYHFYNGKFEYVALSEDFDETPKGGLAKPYVPVVERAAEFGPDGEVVGYKAEFKGWD